jgi:hypothetical protein
MKKGNKKLVKDLEKGNIGGMNGVRVFFQYQWAFT